MRVDVDDFTSINDTHGHAAGDRVLRAVVSTLAARVGTANVARWGGDELVVLLPATGAGAFHLAEQLRADVADGAMGGLAAGAVTFSAGLAARRPDDTVDRILSRADAGLYQAKAAGRDRVRVA